MYWQARLRFYLFTVNTRAKCGVGGAVFRRDGTPEAECEIDITEYSHEVEELEGQGTGKR